MHTESNTMGLDGETFFACFHPIVSQVLGSQEVKKSSENTRAGRHTALPLREHSIHRTDTGDPRTAL